MKNKTIISSLLAIVLLVGWVNAQHVRLRQVPGAQTNVAHVKVFDGNTGAALKPGAGLPNVPVVDLQADTPMHILISAVPGYEKGFEALIGTRASYSMKAIQCDGGSTTTGRSSGGYGSDRILGNSGDDLLIGGTTAHARHQEYFVIKLKPVLVSNYQMSAGTCGLLNVTLANGTGYVGLIRFRSADNQK